MKSEQIIGPGGSCPHCYRQPCICNETAAERQARESREARRHRAQGSMVELLDCEHCGEYGVVPDRVVRAFMCLHCGWQQQPRWIPDEQRKTADPPAPTGRASDA